MNERMRAIAYSMDALIPGIFLWGFGAAIRIGGSVPDDNPYRYPGTIHSRFGLAVVLPWGFIASSYQEQHD